MALYAWDPSSERSAGDKEHVHTASEKHHCGLQTSKSCQTQGSMPHAICCEPLPPLL